MTEDVDLVINVFERTYRTILATGVARSIAESNRRPFKRVVILINNVNEPSSASSMAQLLISNGEIDAFYFVSDLLDSALRGVGLTHSDINPLPYYSDCSLVAFNLPNPSPFICYWDAEVALIEAVNWISPALDLMKKNARIAVANPNWARGELEKEAGFEDGEFALGYGFSDQLFLARVEEFRKPIYNFKTPVSLRYPLSSITKVFEQRVDAYMRCNSRLRATYKLATYRHPDDEGHAYPRMTWSQRAKRLSIGLLLKITALIPTDNPRWKACPRRLID